MLYYLLLLKKRSQKRGKIKTKNRKITSKLRKKCLCPWPVTDKATKYRVYLIKHFREAFCQMVKHLIAANF